MQCENYSGNCAVSRHFMSCVYCKNRIHFTNTFSSLVWWFCENHNNIEVYFEYNADYGDLSVRFKVLDSEYYVWKYIRKSNSIRNITVCKDSLGELIRLPYNKDLTPENFEEKLKLYLNFL
jgi:hypothetical protein